VVKNHRASACRAFLSILIALLILNPQYTIDIAGASGTDTPEPISTEATSRMFVDPEDADTGFTLIAPFNGKFIYLVDDVGDIVHTWKSDLHTSGHSELLEDGTLLRMASGPSQPRGLQILDWDGSELWNYTPPDPFQLHHDFEVMPNGNILLNAAVSYSYSQMIEMGRDPQLTPETLWIEPILEIEPNSSNGGEIVWMWDPLDHIIQDFSPDKPNHGVVADHPDLLDINFPREHSREWQHSNTVSYNAQLDQIMITSRNFDELWVIDHNTTTAEAANHTGGAHGRGGDLLYRWGNPQAYGASNGSDHILWGPHDAQWIAPGLPGEGNIIIFNNGQNLYMTRPEGRYSSVEELVPPVNDTGDYYLALGSAYGPSNLTWYYNASPPQDFFAFAMGGVERLPNGNTLVCGGSAGITLEVDSLGNEVLNLRSQGTFKASRYYPPAMAIVPDLDAIEDVMLRVDISSFLSDQDTDRADLVIGENSAYVRVSGNELLLQYPNGITTDVINLTVSDGIFESGREVRVSVTPVNDPPVLLPIPLIEVVESVPYLLDLRPFISDIDNVIDQMIISEDSSYVTVEDGRLRFQYPDGVLTDRIILVVNDGLVEARTEVHVNVTPVNDPPVVDRIPDQVGIEDVPWTIDLENYIRDIDSPIEDLSVISDSPYAGVMGLTLSLLYPDGVTQDVVSLAVRDGESETVVAFSVTIEPVNDPPVVGTIPPITITEDEPFSLDIGPVILDIDTPMEGLTLRVDSPFIDVDGQLLILLYPEGVYKDEVVVEIWDGDLHASTTFLVIIEPVNDPPWWAELPGHAFKFNYPDGVLREQITFTLTDGEFQIVFPMNVTISPVNDVPELTAADVDPPGGSAGTSFNLTVVYMDVDMGPGAPFVEVVIDGVKYMCARDELDTGSYDEGVVFFLEMDLASGIHSFYFTAEDDNEGIVTTETLSVTVKEVPDTRDRTDMTTIMISFLIIGAVVLVVILMARRRRFSGTHE